MEEMDEKSYKSVENKIRFNTRTIIQKSLRVSRQSIIAIETGKYNPSLELAFNIARQFHCSIEDVFYFEDEEEH